MAYVDPKVACSPWITSDKLCCEGSGEVTDCSGESAPLQYPWSDDDLIQAASNLLFARTCFRYPGVCEREVWPCLESCGCRDNPCRCGSYYAIDLTSDYPILGVDSVEINGVPLDTALWRLDENARVVRTDGERWPFCNNLGLTASVYTDDEVRVSYSTGRVPPVELQMACAELVCELKKACSGDPNCKLPDHVRSVSRRGVNIEVYDVVQLLAQGLTGNAVIDHAITVHGRCNQSKMFDATRSHRHVRIS